MEAIIVSQEGLELHLSSVQAYKIGCARNDDIFILHGEVAPYHAQLVYDNKANSWNVIIRESFRQLPSSTTTTATIGHQTTINSEIDTTNSNAVKASSKYLKSNSRYNRDILFSKELGDNDDGLGNASIEALKPLAGKSEAAVPPRIGFVKRTGHYIQLKTKTPYPLQNNDIVVIGKADSGYRILYKESENPYPKQTHPPEPYGAVLRSRELSKSDSDEKNNISTIVQPLM